MNGIEALFQSGLPSLCQWISVWQAETNLEISFPSLSPSPLKAICNQDSTGFQKFGIFRGLFHEDQWVSFSAKKTKERSAFKADPGLKLEDNVFCLKCKEIFIFVFVSREQFFFLFLNSQGGLRAFLLTRLTRLATMQTSLTSSNVSGSTSRIMIANVISSRFESETPFFSFAFFWYPSL